ncbi:hypothetical protein HanHA89_Chr15g0601941 [Helianthus annuus]|nr:hypothetical protein HanHA89_Chr15g0601941 [Helianthus annuus]
MLQTESCYQELICVPRAFIPTKKIKMNVIIFVFESIVLLYVLIRPNQLIVNLLFDFKQHTIHIYFPSDSLDLYFHTNPYYL